MRFIDFFRSMHSFFKTLNFIANQPLNQKNKLRSIFRFLKWQLTSRLITSTIVYDWINGSRFLVKKGETSLVRTVYVGLNEFPDMTFLMHFLRAEDLFVDIGANVGLYTILASKVVGARSFAFEPIPATYIRLQENICLNHIDGKVTYLNKGIGAQHTSVTFTSDLDGTNHVVAPNEQHENVIISEVLPLDNVLKYEFPTLLKIDVEGYETLVLEGAKETLAKTSLKAIIIELNGLANRYGFNEAKIYQFMSDYGFQAYSYDPFKRNLISNQENLYSANTLFIRDKVFVINRLKNASKFVINGQEL